MIKRKGKIVALSAVLLVFLLSGLILTSSLRGQPGGAEWLEAGQFIEELSACWSAEDYEGAKDLIDAKLSSRPGWLPAKLLESTYYRYIEGDSATAASVAQSIEGTVNALDPNEYDGFLAVYGLYRGAVEAEGPFTQAQKETRLELAHDIFTYFPGAELVAFYFAL